MRIHGVPINMPRNMVGKELKSAITYYDHYSANNKITFVRGYIAKQLQAGHIDIFPLEVIHHLLKMWICPLAMIPQTIHKPRLIHHFLWGRLNNLDKVASHKYVMQFVKALHRLIYCIVPANP